MVSGMSPKEKKMANQGVEIRVKQSVVLEDNAAWTNRFQVKSQSSDRIYIIAQSKKSRFWACSCPGFLRYKHCKHTTSLGLPGDYQPFEATLTTTH